MSFFKKIERIHNNLSDKNFVWFPFIYLKPAKNQEMSVRLILIMAISFAFYYNLFGFIHSYFIMKSQAGFYDFIIGQILWTIGFLLWFKFVTSFFWNKRAKTIQ